jgi:hypothetical protein
VTVTYGGFPNFSLVALPASSGSFTIPNPPTPSVGEAKLLKPNWTSLASGKDPYRPWVCAILDGIAYFANGWDQAWFADVNGAAFWPLGSVAPTSFVVSDAAGGSSQPIGTELTYYLVFRNPDMGEETAPQPTDDGTGNDVAGVTHVMAATKDVLITWTAAEATARFTKVRIYRRRQSSDDFVLVAEVASSAGTYTDSTAEADLSTALEDEYVDRYRLDLPPIFKGIAAHLGRLFGFTGTDANLYYGQQALPTGELVQTDFPAGNIIPVEPDDGLGEITAVVAHYDTLLVFKRRGCYALDGDDPANFAVRRMFADRGALSQRCVIPLLATLVFLDERGLYAWAPSAEPVVVGAKSGVAASPLAPLWARLNLDAADMMHLVHNEALGYVEAWIALDASPQARHRVRWNYRQDRLESVDDGIVSHAAGILEDGTEAQHVVHLDDLGFLWEQDVGDSEGVFAGDTTATLTGGTLPSVTASGAAFSTDELLGSLGCPVDRYDASGNILDENRVVAVTGTTLRMLRYSPTAAAAGQSVAVGVIRDLWRLPTFDFATGDRKTVPYVIVEFEVETESTLRVDTTSDEHAFTRRREIDLSDDNGWAIVPCNDRGFRWTAEFSSRYAGYGYAVRALRINWRAGWRRV